MTEVTIYHNPRCSKSRQTLQLLREHGVEPVVVEYLEHPPDPRRLKALLEMLGMNPRELIRTKEAEYRELGLDAADLGNNELIRAMSEHPVLIERPIVVAGERAVVGRPPEKVLELLQAE